ncbi:MAG: glycosyltransferase family A protein [Rectinemataceae bacterium]|nr:glycosyltransferase family A protein [Rectinemataceae bacterium]
MGCDIEHLPVVSVIIPLYNKARFIEKTLRSVIAQEYADFEVIVIDDGSKDDGADRAEALGDIRIKVLRFPNGGVSTARNRGIQSARSEFVAFLDADDYWEPQFLSSLLMAFKKNPEVVAAFCAILEGSARINRMPKVGSIIEDYPKWFIRTNGRGLWSSNLMARKDALERAGGFPEGVQNGEDTDTWFRLSFQGPIAYIPKALARYGADDAASLSRTTPATQPIVISTLKKAVTEFSLPHDRLESALTAISYFHIAYATALAQGGVRKQAAKELLQSEIRLSLAYPMARALFALIFAW